LKLSTRSRYGLRMMLELAKKYKEGPVSVKDISEVQNISIKYLQQLAIILEKGGLIKSFRGAYGGYQLTREPAFIRVKDAVVLLEGNLYLVPCLQDENYCERSRDCVTRKLWQEVNDKLLKVLDSYTIQDLVKMEGNGKERTPRSLQEVL